MNEDTIFEVITTDKERVRIKHLLVGDKWHPNLATYTRNKHVLQSMRAVNTPNRTLIVSCYYILDPKTNVFIFQGMASAELSGFEFRVEVVGNITHLDEGGRNIDSLNRAAITLAEIETE